MSIHIYREYPQNYNRDNILIDNDNYFWQNISANMIDELGKKVMQQIDQAKLIDVESEAIKTPFGITNLENLSTGCKTVLNYMYASEKYRFIDITQCGANALEVLFSIIEKVKHPSRYLIL